MQLASMRVGASFPSKATTQANSLHFHEKGEYLITASDDKTLKLYNCTLGSNSKTINVTKCGASNVRFTHHASAVIASSQGGEWEGT